MVSKRPSIWIENCDSFKFQFGSSVSSVCYSIFGTCYFKRCSVGNPIKETIQFLSTCLSGKEGARFHWVRLGNGWVWVLFGVVPIIFRMLAGDELSHPIALWSFPSRASPGPLTGKSVRCGCARRYDRAHAG